jgi:protein AbiQ
MKKLYFYYIDMKYVRNLGKVDDNVMSVSPQSGKQNRPFIGVVTILNNKKYCIPLTSPKAKFRGKSGVDYIKIFDDKKVDSHGTNIIIGVLNINNMIPVDEAVISRVDLKINKQDSSAVAHSKELLQNQLNWCREHSDIIERRANKVYDLVVNNPNKNMSLISRCCNFKKLEDVLSRYSSKYHKQPNSVNEPMLEYGLTDALNNNEIEEDDLEL